MHYFNHYIACKRQIVSSQGSMQPMGPEVIQGACNRSEVYDKSVREEP